MAQRFRILHCGTNLTNYQQCIEHGVVGFKRRVAQSGDIVFLSVNVAGDTYCGARGIAGEETDIKPWEDAELYVQCFLLRDVAFCEPFPLSVLSSLNKFWHLYYQAAKTLTDDRVLAVLQEHFEERLISQPYLFTGVTPVHGEQVDIRAPIPASGTERTDDRGVGTGGDEQPDDPDIVDDIAIVGAFQTIRFVNETHQSRGLETLVNKNFHLLFPQFREEASLFITDNRMFLTSGLTPENRNESVAGVRGIPDALLVVRQRDCPLSLQLNVIEYECYGEAKATLSKKVQYLNGHIIPQLMTFASAFSLTTDSQIRQGTISSWTDKIIQYFQSSEREREKFFGWIRSSHPEVSEWNLGLLARQLLLDAFRSNLRIVLIIDELTSEHRETIKSIINSFKLEKGSPVDFGSYVVRLSQRIVSHCEQSEYVLSVE